MRALLLHGEKANNKFNNARGLWPYIAHVWESKSEVSSTDADVDKSSNSSLVSKLSKRLAHCFFRLKSAHVIAIAAAYNNRSILDALRAKEQ